MTAYRKSGRNVRFERRGDASAFMATTESGTFDDGGGRAEVRSGLPMLPGLPASSEVQRQRVEALVAVFENANDRRMIEQLVIMSGVAVHQFEEVNWQESITQVIATIVDRPRAVRYTLLRGGAVDDDELSRSLGNLLQTMALPDRDFEGKSSVTLAPPVAAELTRFLFHASLPAVSFRQEAPFFSTHDGVGRVIASRQLSADAPSTTVYRPTYRVAPVRHPLHLRAQFRAVTSSSSLRLVQLSQPPRLRDGSIELIGLMSDDEGASLQQLLIPFDAVALIKCSPGEAAWFPIAGGTWGETLIVWRAQSAASSRAAIGACLAGK